MRGMLLLSITKEVVKARARGRVQRLLLSWGAQDKALITMDKGQSIITTLIKKGTKDFFPNIELMRRCWNGMEI